MHAYACNFFKEELHGRCLLIILRTFAEPLLTGHLRATSFELLLKLWLRFECCEMDIVVFLLLNLNRNSEEYLIPCQTPTMELFWETNQRLKLVNFFRRKSSSQMFDTVHSTNLALLAGSSQTSFLKILKSQLYVQYVHYLMFLFIKVQAWPFSKLSFPWYVSYETPIFWIPVILAASLTNTN